MLQAGAAYLRIVGPAYGFFGLGLALYFASQGAGRLLWPLLGSPVRLIIGIGGGWLALRSTGSLDALFWALAGAMVAYGGVVAVAIAPVHGSSRCFEAGEPRREPIVVEHHPDTVGAGPGRAPISRRQLWIIAAAGLVFALIFGVRQSAALFIGPIHSATGLGIAAITVAFACVVSFCGASAADRRRLAATYGTGRVEARARRARQLGIGLTPAAATVRWTFVVLIRVVCGGRGRRGKRLENGPS